MTQGKTKLSFYLSSSKPRRPTLKALQDQASSCVKEFFTELDASKTLINLNSKIPDVIAPIANEWRPHKKRRSIDPPHTSADPNAANSTVESVELNVSYGLNVCGKKDSKSKARRFQSTERLILNKLSDDLVKLPADRGMDEFEDMPVENFAAALLKGYGWHEGKGIGKNAKEDVMVFEIKQRIGREGIGFVDDMRTRLTKYNSNNNIPAAIMNKETVSKASSGSRRNCKCDSGHDSKRSSKRGRERHETSDTCLKSWLSSHIRVRIISKEVKGGRLYLQKGEIVDVVGPTTCDIVMDDSGELIKGVEQEFLQTALSRRGGPVLVLCGRHKGVYGSLHERDLDNETAVVRDADTHALIKVKLDQIAEYVGDFDGAC